MRIIEVETLLMSHVLPREQRWRWNGGSIEGWNAAFVRIQTDQKLHGLGEVYFGAFVPEMIPPVVEDLKKHLIGEDPFRIGYLWQKINSVSKFWNRHGFGKSVIAGIDIALHDLVGKATKVPVYQLLGGLCHPSMRTYASGGCSESAEVLVREIRQAQANGFGAYKWRLIDSSRAGSLMKQLREEVGPDFDIMVDIVQGSAPRPWSAATVLDVAAELAPHRPLWLEEPFAIEDKRAYRELRARVPYSIAGGEGVSSLEEAWEFLQERAVDVLQPDATIAGGLSLCKMIGVLAYSQHVQIASHSWGGAGSLMANLHFALSNPSSTFTEYCQLSSPFREDLLEEPLRLVNGCIQPPSAPGLGIRLSDDVLSRYAYRESVGHVFRWETQGGTPATGTKRVVESDQPQVVPL
ncbi:MAG: mandelate racemase/muconate lactonizing enzyme family protein [Acidobacteriota bacterium]